MAVYPFELSFSAPAGEEILNALYEAGWDDAVVSLDPRVGGNGVAAFDRDAPSAVHAIASAIQEGGNAGVQVTGVSEDLVTLSEVAERIGRGFSTVDHWANGRRGSGDFPAPRIARSRNSLYSWAEVTAWLHVRGMVELPEEALELAQVCEVADAMIRSRVLQEKLPAAERKKLADVVGSVLPRLAIS